MSTYKSVYRSQARTPVGVRSAHQAPKLLNTTRRPTTHLPALLRDPVKTQASPTWEKIHGLEVIRSSDGAELDITTLWKNDERALVAFSRSLGCPFCWELAIQLRRDIKPQLDERGIKLFLVSIGTWERSKEFVKVTGFPAENLFVDPDNVLYTALGLSKGIPQTFFSPETPWAILKRIQAGKMADLQDVLPRWQPWKTPKLDQALQQGGMFLFDGNQCLFEHYDKATGSHANLEEVLGLAFTVPAVACEC